MTHVGVTQAAEIAFNQTSIDRSAGMMVQLTGAESLWSVSNSHFTLALRAALHGCRTPEASLARDEGRIALHKPREDTELKTLLDEGWEWTVVPAYAQILFPRLASHAQSALNANQAAYSFASEIRSCVPWLRPLRRKVATLTGQR
jgi:hypothetical protein